MTDQPGEPNGSAIHQRDAPAAAIDAEDGVFSSDPQVAPDRQLQATGHGVSLDGGDHRLFQQHSRGANGAVAVGLHPARPGGVRLLHRLEIRARAELPARPGQHGDRGRVVLLEAAEGSASASAVGRSIAFATSGRSIVTMATGPSAS